MLDRWPVESHSGMKTAQKITPGHAKVRKMYETAYVLTYKHPEKERLIMQVMMTEIPEREMLRLLTEDLFERNKKIRFQALANQVVNRIAEKWLMAVMSKKLWDKPVKCVAWFVMHDEAGMPIEGSVFALSTTLESHCKTRSDEYLKQVRGALNGIAIDLCNNYDLDHLEFNGPKAVIVFEYHGDCMGNL